MPQTHPQPQCPGSCSLLVDPTACGARNLLPSLLEVSKSCQINHLHEWLSNIDLATSYVT